MKLKSLFLGAILLFGSTLYAFEPLHWNQGSVVMENGLVLQGELAFQVSELVLFRAEGEVMVYPPHKVQSFYYYDKEENINRKFVSLRTDQNRQGIFFEVVVWGEVSILRKLKTHSIGNRKKSDKYDYDYFVRTPQSIVALKDFRRKVYPMLISTPKPLLSLVKEQGLNPNEYSDVIGIIKLYNKLSHSKIIVVSF